MQILVTLSLHRADEVTKGQHLALIKCSITQPAVLTWSVVIISMKVFKYHLSNCSNLHQFKLQMASKDKVYKFLRKTQSYHYHYKDSHYYDPPLKAVKAARGAFTDLLILAITVLFAVIRFCG